MTEVAKKDRTGEAPLLLRIDPDCTALTSLSRSTLYELIAVGEIPVLRFGRAVRVRRIDLEAWIDRQPASASQ